MLSRSSSASDSGDSGRDGRDNARDALASPTRGANSASSGQPSSSSSPILCTWLGLTWCFVVGVGCAFVVVVLVIVVAVAVPFSAAFVQSEFACDCTWTRDLRLFNLFYVFALWLVISAASNSKKDQTIAAQVTVRIGGKPQLEPPLASCRR